MRSGRAVAVMWIAIWACLAARQAEADAAATQAATSSAPAIVRVMTANMRFAAEDDKQNAWPLRRDLVVQTLLKYGPDIVGCQEVSPAQGAFFSRHLPGYSAVQTVGDDPGILGLAGTALNGLVQIYYRSDRYEVIESQGGLLRPEAIQGKLTENTFFVQAVLKDKATGAGWIVFDAHLRHGVENATASATKLRRFVADNLKLYPGAGVIVLGDMNHDERSPVWKALTQGDGGLLDTFDYLLQKKGERWGTYHAFTGKAHGAEPSDLIFVGGNAQVAQAAEIVRDHAEDGRYPSDHFFVVATVAKK